MRIDLGIICVIFLNKDSLSDNSPDSRKSLWLTKVHCYWHETYASLEWLHIVTCVGLWLIRDQDQWDKIFCASFGQYQSIFFKLVYRGGPRELDCISSSQCNMTYRMQESLTGHHFLCCVVYVFLFFFLSYFFYFWNFNITTSHYLFLFYPTKLSNIPPPCSFFIVAIYRHTGIDTDTYTYLHPHTYS